VDLLLGITLGIVLGTTHGKVLGTSLKTSHDMTFEAEIGSNT